MFERIFAWFGIGYEAKYSRVHQKIRKLVCERNINQAIQLCDNCYPVYQSAWGFLCLFMKVLYIADDAPRSITMLKYMKTYIEKHKDCREFHYDPFSDYLKSLSHDEIDDAIVSVEFYRQMANMLDGSKLGYETTVKAYRKVLELDPRDLDSISRLASVYGYMGEDEKAMILLEEALCYDPMNMEYISSIAGFNMRLHNYGEAVRLLETIKDQFGSHSGLWGLFARAKYLSGDYQGSLEAFDRAIEIYPMYFCNRDMSIEEHAMYKKLQRMKGDDQKIRK